MELTLVGFGTTGNEDGKLGIKRIATNQIDDVTSTRFRFSGTGDGEGGTCVGTPEVRPSLSTATWKSSWA